MTPQVVSVRQDLLPLVRRAPQPRGRQTAHWRSWGATCGATSCSPTVPGIEHQWRSGLGITADGALVYVAGPALDPLQLADLLARAGAVRAMQLDINPDLAGVRDLRSPGGRPGRPGQRPQAAGVDRAGPMDVLRVLVGPRLHHHVGPVTKAWRGGAHHAPFRLNI